MMPREEIFSHKAFSYPKPLNLLIYLLKTIEGRDSTILDFFAGSGTTLHAVMKLNAEDGGNRTCILVTNNENGICQRVTLERCRRVIEGYDRTDGQHVAGYAGNTLRYVRLDEEKTRK